MTTQEPIPIFALPDKRRANWRALLINVTTIAFGGLAGAIFSGRVVDLYLLLPSLVIIFICVLAIWVVEP